MSLTSRLARRFCRDLPILRTAGASALVAAFVLGANAYLDSQTLTEDQWVESQLADYQLRYSPQVSVPLGAPAAQSLALDVEEAVTGSTTALLCIDLPVTSIADDGVTYLEADWTTGLKDRYALDAGKWPSEPGEVVVVGEVGVSARLGDQVNTLGRTPLTIVGAARDRFVDRDGLVLAAPGTWGALDSPDAADLAAVAATIRVYLPSSDRPTEAQSRVEAVLRSHGLKLRQAGADAMESRGDLVRGAPESLLGRSPILFWLPSLLLFPLAIALTVMAQFRRIVPAARNLHALGASRFTAVTAPWLPVYLVCLLGAAAGGAAGFVAATSVANLIAGRYAAPAPSVGLPLAGLGALVCGVAAGGLISWLAFVNRALPRRTKVASRLAPRGRVGTTGERPRRAAALFVGCAVVYRALSVDDGWSILQLACLCVVGAVLLAPETSSLVARLIPDARLSGTLSRRLILTYRFRAATYVAVLAAGFGVTVGVVTSVNSAVAAERGLQAVVAPEGLLALDNDGAPSLPVAAVVRRAAEQVPALGEQTPVQLWSTGRLGPKDKELRGYATTSKNDGVVFAVDTSTDLERLFQRTLSSAERTALENGGMVAVGLDARTPTTVVSLRGSDSALDYGEVPIAVATLRHDAPWYTFVPGYVLRSTAKSLGIPVTPGALVYTDITAAAADSVLASLADAGINPEQAAVHHDQPKLLPDPALAGMSAFLIALSCGVALLLTRSQVSGMRVWLYGLGRLGVQTRWTRRVLVGQNLALTLGGVGAGAAAGLLPIAWGTVALPALVVDVPWTIIASTALSMLFACVGVTWLSLRRGVILEPGRYSRAE